MRIKNPELVPIQIAARVMCIDPPTLMYALQQKQYSEFGEAIKRTSSWRYLIHKKKFDEWCVTHKGIPASMLRYKEHGLEIPEEWKERWKSTHSQAV